ncbi:flagellar hook-length control protein FliK [Bacillus xiapuensis]|uniref:flagellar hook-length control protein FliK n=1 Tax=Bacillus xiapuensis TaxID=2014075 RepID=UPI000C2323CD|nr:flagellar hook-length control protein FliK [Bacillus xiapuensis]
MMQAVTAAANQAAAPQETAPKTAASGKGFQSLLQEQTDVAALEPKPDQQTQSIANNIGILQAKSMEEIPAIPPALKQLLKEWMSDGKMPAFSDIAALLGVQMGELQQLIQQLSEQLNHIPLKQESEDAESPSFAEGEGIAAESVLHVIQLLAAAEPKNWPVKERKTIETILQAGKLWELMGTKADMNSKQIQLHQKVKQQLEELAVQLGKQLPSPKQKSALILQKAFTHYLQPAADRMNSSNLQNAFIQHANGKIVADSRTIAEPSALGKEGAQSIQPLLHTLGNTDRFTMTVSTNPKPMNMEQFIEKFTRMLGSSNMVKTPNGHKLLIKLYPEQLGSLRVELLQQNGVMTARILSSTAMVKDLLEQHAHSLKQAFGQQNIAVDKLEITFSQADPQKFDRSSQQQQQQAKQQQSQKQQPEPEEQPAEEFKDVLLNIEV